MDTILEHTVFLFITAILVALLARRLHLPYTVGLVLTGIALSITHAYVGIALTREFIFDVILPPLLFEATLNIHWKELKKDSLPIMLLAVLGVMISALFVTGAIILLLGWQWQPALIFGVLIAATDPVAVIAMFKDNHVKGRLRLLVESESLFNDGVAAVLFAIVLSCVQSNGHIPAGPALQSLAYTVLGGVLAGTICAGFAIFIAGHTAEHLIETALTTATAYGAFILAEHLHVSGVLATVTTGLLMGNLGILCEDSTNSLSGKGRAFIIDFWEFVAFLANSLIFLLIGLRVATIPFSVLGVGALSIIIIMVVVGRALTVYPLCMPLLKSKWAIPLRYQHILWWGGLRGALGLALALSLPDSLPMHDEIIIATFGVVAFSVIVQGLSMPFLLRRLKCNG